MVRTSMSRLLFPKSIWGSNVTRKTKHPNFTIKNYFSSFRCRYCRLLRSNRSDRRVVWKHQQYYSNGQTKPSYIAESSEKTTKKLERDRRKVTVMNEALHKELISVLNTRVSNISDKTFKESVAESSSQFNSSRLCSNDEVIQNPLNRFAQEKSRHCEKDILSFDDDVHPPRAPSDYLCEKNNFQENNPLSPDELHIENQNKSSLIKTESFLKNIDAIKADNNGYRSNKLNERETFEKEFKKFDESLQECVNSSLEILNTDSPVEGNTLDEFLNKFDLMENYEMMKLAEPVVNVETCDENSDSTSGKSDKIKLLTEQIRTKPNLQKLKSPGTKLSDSIDDGLSTESGNTKKNNVYLTELKNNKSLRQKENFHMNLKAFLSVCVDANESKLAKATIKHYVNKQRNRPSGSKSPRMLSDSSVFHRLLYSFAKQGSILSVKEVFLLMDDIDVTPSFQCYAAYLECLGRQKNIDVEACEALLSDIVKQNYVLEDIFKECIIINDNRNYILKAIHAVRPDFVPRQRIEDYIYNGPLLKRLNESLSQNEMIEANPYANTVDSDYLKQQVKLQLQMEKDSFVKVKSVAKSTELSEKTKHMRKKLEECKELWRSQLEEGLKSKMDELKTRGQGISLYPYFKVLDTDDYIELMIKELLRKVAETDGYTTDPFSASRLGNQIYTKYHIKKMEEYAVIDKILKVYNDYTDYYTSSSREFSTFREAWQHLMQKYEDGTDLDGTFEKWPYFVTSALGKLLYEIIVKNCTFDANVHRNTTKKKMVPALYIALKGTGIKKFECLKAHPSLLKLYTEADIFSTEMEFDVKEMPMLVPPVPWCSTNIGGFLVGPTMFIRLPKSAKAQEERIGSMNPSQLYPVTDALNILSACAWRVNKPVLDIVIDLFNNKGNKDLDIPPPVSECLPPPIIDKKLPTAELIKVKFQHTQWKQMKNDMFGLWCVELYRLSIANKFRDQTFWFPHNVDFRGRTYPCPPHFNQLGNDVSRAILIFAKGKPLGHNGLDWLKIHLINLTGLKKRCSTEQRLQYANEIMPDILDSADHPMDGRKWWQKSDEPWQTLACCMEIAKASRTPDPSKYICHFPVHQDGSCNGLQHYAALGRDQSGAESVNLYPFDSPKDVYSDVLALVEEERQKDAENGSEIAKQLEGHLTRSVIKQTIMTTVYGVTRFGARRQIYGQLQDKAIPYTEAWKGSSYLTVKVFYCLQKMFTSAREIQDWLALTSYLISFLCQKPVEWMTPIGLPVLQPYHKKILLNILNTQVLDLHNINVKPNVMKQKNGFPPNFIHSLDSTHMMLTALYCYRAGINYVSVHDCFWTHPCDIETMNKITREQFVALHNQPILENLSQELMKTFSTETRLSPINEKKTVQECCKHLNIEINDNDMNLTQLFNTVVQSVPKKGKFDLNNVLKSIYFFS